MKFRVLFSAIACAFATTVLTVPTVEAGPYPGNKCVGDKLKAASSNCKAILKAHSSFVGGGGSDMQKRDDAIAKAVTKMASTWSKAEAKALSKDVDCADTTLTAVAMQALITSQTDAIVTDVTTGLTLSNGDDAKCGASLLKSASDKCAALLKSEAGYIQKLAAGKTKRDAANLKANTKFGDKVTDALVGCPTGATLGSLGGAVDDLTGDVITNSIISPNVDDSQFTTISPPSTFPGPSYEGSNLRPRCSHSTPYHYFVKKGTVNKLVMYYQGGGACWNFITCGLVGTFDQDVNPGGSDNPNNTSTGFGDLDNPLNPFKDWNIVFVSYCTGDIHFGDRSNQSYNGGSFGTVNIQHVGWQNARTAEKWAREHFVNPDEIFVTGSSAGAYGALFNAPLHHNVWPDSKFSVLGDAGNGVITEEFLETRFPVWNFAAHLPTDIPGVIASIEDGTGMPAYLEAVSNFYPDTAWGNYTTSYDGGTGGQTGFYNVMQNDDDDPGTAAATWPNWWNASCEWNDLMRQQAIDTAAAVATTTDNYRYYIGTGSRHTMYGSDKVYTDVSGGMPLTIRDWIEAMRARSGWNNVECSSDCGVLLSGDPRENGNPPPVPFVDDNADNIADRIFCP